MLTLQRREGQALVIQHKGEELVIKLTGTREGRVKVNLAGPKSFDVARQEIVEAVKHIEKLLNE